MTAAVLERPRARGRHVAERHRTLATTAGPVGLALSLLSLVGLVVTLSAADPGDINGYGLVGAFPPAAFLALGVIVAVLVFSLFTPGISAAWLVPQVVILGVALSIGPALVEPLPRFSTAWTHAGFAEYVARSGQVLHETDARFSWPAFFGAAGFFAQAVGVEPLQLLRWTPVVLSALYLVPLTVILRSFIDDGRRRVVALTIFVVGNWVGQDYFAPQGFNFLLFLVIVAVLLRALSWGRADSRLARIVRGTFRLREGDDALPQESQGFGERATLLLVVVAMYAASVVSHQLTQFFILLAVAALVVVGVCRLRWLVVLFAVMTLAYFVWGAQDYWAGHLRDITDNLGAFGTSLQENVSARATSSSAPAREVVVRVRLGLTLAVLVLAAIGLIRSRRRILVVPALLAFVPVLVMGLQSYGGEMALRVYFFSLVWLAILGAHALHLDGDARRARWRVATHMVATTLVALLATGGFLLARYGNESFEWMRPGDVSAVQELYEVAPPGSVLFSLTESVPWRDHALERYHHVYALPTPLTRDDLPSLLDAMRKEERGAYLVLTDSQWVQLKYLAGFSDDAIAEAKEMFRTTPELTRLFGSGDVGVYVLTEEAP
jgi:hypothetical protein